MNDDRRDDRSGAPDPSQDSWSAWLPELDPTRDRTQPPAEDVPEPPRKQLPPPPPQLPQLPHLPAPPPPARARPVAQPMSRASGRAPAYGRRPKSYLGLAILVTFFFWPFGLVSLVMATIVGSRWARGDVDGAYRASRAARAWAVAGVVAMFVMFLMASVVAGTMWSIVRH